MIIFYLLFSLTSFAQKDSVKQVIVPQLIMNCAHSHDCCSIRCNCCPLMHRDQVYDTSIIATENANIERLEIRAKYNIARQIIPSQLKYIFRYNKDSLSEVYYDASGIQRGFFHYSSPHEKSLIQENFKKDELVFTQSGDYKLLNALGESKKINYHTKEALSNGNFLVSIFVNGQKIMGIVDENLNKLSQLKYFNIEYIEECSAYIYQAHSNAYSIGYGILNDDFEEVELDAPYIEHLVGDVFKMRNMKGYCLVNLEGKAISDFYWRIYDYSEGLIYAKKDEDKKGVFIDAYGKEQFRIKCDYAAPFSEGLARFKINNRWGYVDSKGKIVLVAKYLNAYDFKDGAAPVAVAVENNYNNIKWTIVDQQGEFLIDPVYDEMDPFKYGVTVVGIRGAGYGLMNTKWKLILDEKYKLNSFGHFLYQNEKLMVICMDFKSHEYVLLNEKMKEVASLNNYDHASFLFDRPINGKVYIMAVKKDQRFLLNEKGEKIFDEPLTSIAITGKENFLILKKEGKKGAVLYDLRTNTVVNILWIMTYFCGLEKKSCINLG